LVPDAKDGQALIRAIVHDPEVAEPSRSAERDTLLAAEKGYSVLTFWNPCVVEFEFHTPLDGAIEVSAVGTLVLAEH
jgi:hypothetical protein